MNLVDALNGAPERTQVASLAGLEKSANLGDILVIANNVREEFRKQLGFPLVLWVTDELEVRLRREAPDLVNWAALVLDFEKPIQT